MKERRSPLNLSNVPSLTTFIGTPVPLSIHTIIQSGNYVRAALCIHPCRYRSRNSVKIQIKHQNGGNILSDFVGSIKFVVGSSQASLTGWDSHKKKDPISHSSVGRNTLLMREVREEWTDWFELTGLL